MDRIEKFLKRLTRDERTLLQSILERVNRGDLEGLDVKKLKGFPGLFRVRKGNIRVIFQREKQTTKVISIDRRGEDTYKF